MLLHVDAEMLVEKTEVNKDKLITDLTGVSLKYVCKYADSMNTQKETIFYCSFRMQKP